MRHPFSTIPRRRLLQHSIHLFERQAFRFGNEEVGVEEAADAEGAPDEEDFGAEVAFVGVDHVGGYYCDYLWGGLLGYGFCRWGVERGKGFWGELTQFHSQFDAVERATPRDRIGKG